LVLLALVPIAARLRGTAVRPAAITHHRIVAAYLCLAVFGYIAKSYVSNFVDMFFTVVFFIIGPVLCFAYWSRRMWNTSPIDFESANVAAVAVDDAIRFERHGSLPGRSNP